MPVPVPEIGKYGDLGEWCLGSVLTLQAFELIRIAIGHVGATRLSEGYS